MIRILLSGSEGRMGETLKSLILKEEELTLEFSFDKRGSLFDFNAVSVSSLDVIIDFSSPELFLKMLLWAGEKGIPLVSGTTGLDQKIKDEIKKCSQKIPLFWASNMSLGIALLMRALSVFSNCEKGFDFQVEEIHHRNKKDKPSGTALSLQEKLHFITQRDLPDVLSIRGGGVYGVHKIWAFSKGETLSFEHTAINREVFAEGALKAAKWIISQKPGLYGMEDLVR